MRHLLGLEKLQKLLEQNDSCDYWWDPYIDFIVYFVYDTFEFTDPSPRLVSSISSTEQTICNVNNDGCVEVLRYELQPLAMCFFAKIYLNV